jgi:NCAIR mutase (PurE)-related protein
MLSEQSIRELLQSVACGEKTTEQAMLALRSLPYEDLGTARIDHHRALRRGCPEVIYCAGKTPQQVAQITQQLAAHHPRVLGTRATREHFAAAREVVDDVQYDEPARCLWMDRNPGRNRQSGVLLIAAGTSDFPVAQEAARTLDFLGHVPKQIYDVGVAGIHRLFDELPHLNAAKVIIVIAGMEGALSSVVAGLVAAPVIAVPTSVGYGASFGGIAALLGMLNSCASGIGVVNIDNGFGAAYLAASINCQILRKEEGRDQ